MMWIILHQVRHYQTRETQSLEVVEAFTGDDPAAVERAARGREDELCRGLKDSADWYTVSYEAMPVPVVTFVETVERPGPEPKPSMSTGEFVSLITNGPNWNK